MGGLIGWVDFARDLTLEPGVVQAMTETLRQRGAQESAVLLQQHYAFGGRGVADARPGDEGQPFRLEIRDGQIIALHTGTIHNQQEVRAKLAARGVACTGASAGELLARAYLQWGEDCVTHFEGMFASLVFDTRARKLVLLRDHVGLKPLYYHHYGTGILVGTLPKAIFANPLFEPRLDLAKLPIVLQPRLTLAGETPLHGLSELPSGHIAVLTPDGFRLRRYWQLESRPHEDSYDDTVARVRTLLEASVAQRLDARMPWAAMLSGGIDSTAVAALAARILRKREGGGDDGRAPLHTFCIAFDNDEDHFAPTDLRPDIDAPFAAAAARHIGTHHHPVTRHAQDLIAAIPRTRAARDLPSFGQFDASMLLLFESMRAHADIGLTGEAADELFGGYPYFFSEEALAGEGFPWMGNGPALADLLAPDLRDRIKPREDEAARCAAIRAATPRLEGEDAREARMREAFHFGLCGPLAMILDRKERMSASVGLDIRVPFLDRALMEYVWNIPWSFKARGGVKGLLKDAVRDILPPETLSRKKSAYPQVQNPLYDMHLLDAAEAALREPGSVVAELFDSRAALDYIASIRAGDAPALQGRKFPGGANAAHMFIHLVEMKSWMDDYGIRPG